MATYFYFPSSTGAHTLPNGDTMRVVIKYDLDNAALTTANIAAAILDPGVLNIPLEVSPSGNTFRHAYIDLTLHNLDDVFSSANAGGSGTSILNASFKDEIYIDIYINGSIFFNGLLEFSQINRSDYRLDNSGNLVYDKIKFRAVDILSYFWTRSVTLADVSYADGILLTDLIDNITDEIGLGNVLDSNFSFTEENGLTYRYRDLYLGNMDSSVEVSTFLKAFMNGTASFIYSLKGNVYFTQRINGTTAAVNNTYLMRFDRRDNANYVEYILLQATIQTDPLTYGDFHTQFSFNELTFNGAAGSESKNTRANVSIDATGAINHLFTVASGTAVVPGGAGYAASSGSNTSLTDSGINYNTLAIESGDQVNLIDDSETTFVEKLTASDTMQITDCGVTVALNDHYNIYRGYDGTDRRRFKIFRMIENAIEAYSEYYQTNANVFNARLRDVSAWSDLSKRLTIDGNNYRVKSAKFDFENDYCDFELIRVS